MFFLKILTFTFKHIYLYSQYDFAARDTATKYGLVLKLTNFAASLFSHPSSTRKTAKLSFRSQIYWLAVKILKSNCNSEHMHVGEQDLLNRKQLALSLSECLIGRVARQQNRNKISIQVIPGDPLKLFFAPTCETLL